MKNSKVEERTEQVDKITYEQKKVKDQFQHQRRKVDELLEESGIRQNTGPATRKKMKFGQYPTTEIQMAFKVFIKANGSEIVRKMTSGRIMNEVHVQPLTRNVQK